MLKKINISNGIKGKVLILISIILILVNIYIYNNRILVWNGVMIEAQALNLVESLEGLQYIEKREIDWYSVFFGGDEFNTSSAKMVYYKKVEYKYTVNGVEYVGADIYEVTELDDVKGDEKGTIKITYDSTNPNKSKIGRLKYGFDVKNMTDLMNVICIVTLGVMGIILVISDIPVEFDYAGKNKTLKVEKIESLDYERERVIFTDDEQKLYIYETDFGEEFKENETYKIKLNYTNQNKTTIQ